ncbi:hypothetical protein MKX08_004169 [Trichoderma sp. CBMAI-0020]|nr:hypothetical protein MKX08_004169 [Trichoderma sp. CBMAI-0020]
MNTARRESASQRIAVMDFMDNLDVDRLPPGRPRTQMTVEEKSAFLRVAAAADPASVTRADKNQIFGRPPPDEEDCLCQEKIGMTMEELRRKAMSVNGRWVFSLTKSIALPRKFSPCWKMMMTMSYLAVQSSVPEPSKKLKRKRYFKSVQERDAEEDAKWQKEFTEMVKTSRLFNPPPTKLSPEERALYLRIVADPASATRADKNKVYEKPPPDEEDRLCKEKVGVAMEELRHKALFNPDAMTEDECNILIRGVKKREKSNGRYSLWKFRLVEDDRELSRQVDEILYTQEDIEIQRRAHHRHHHFDDVIEERRKRIKQQRIDEREATYGEGTKYKWVLFRSIYNRQSVTQLHECWASAASLSSAHYPLPVSDPLLEGADIDTLRQRFKAMREQGEIPQGIATDRFLVADQAALDDPYLTSKTSYKPKVPGDPNPWQSTITVRAINPDYEASVPIASEGDLAGHQGEITIPLPKVFDWLYYSFFAKSEDWETRYKLVKGGPAEMMSHLSQYPAYRPGAEPANLSEILPP